MSVGNDADVLVITPYKTKWAEKKSNVPQERQNNGSLASSKSLKDILKDKLSSDYHDDMGQNVQQIGSLYLRERELELKEERNRKRPLHIIGVLIGIAMIVWGSCFLLNSIRASNQEHRYTYNVTVENK